MKNEYNVKLTRKELQKIIFLVLNDGIEVNNELVSKLYHSKSTLTKESIISQQLKEQNEQFGDNVGTYASIK